MEPRRSKKYTRPWEMEFMNLICELVYISEDKSRIWMVASLKEILLDIFINSSLYRFFKLFKGVIGE